MWNHGLPGLFRYLVTAYSGYSVARAVSRWISTVRVLGAKRAVSGVRMMASVRYKRIWVSDRYSVPWVPIHPGVPGLFELQVFAFVLLMALVGERRRSAVWPYVELPSVPRKFSIWSGSARLRFTSEKRSSYPSPFEDCSTGIEIPPVVKPESSEWMATLLGTLVLHRRGFLKRCGRRRRTFSRSSMVARFPPQLRTADCRQCRVQRVPLD